MAASASMGLPISGATGTYSVPIFTYYHSFSFFGRSANVDRFVALRVGNFQGTVFGAENRTFTVPVFWT